MKLPPSPTTYGETYKQVTANGYRVLPVRQGAKEPLIRGWQHLGTRPADFEQCDKWARQFGDQGLGIACGPLIVADIDHVDPEAAAEQQRLVERILGDTPLLRIGNPPKIQLMYRTEHHVSSRALEKFDLLASKRFTVAFNTHPRTGQPYSWPRLSPLDVPFRDLPLVNPNAIQALLAKIPHPRRPKPMAIDPLKPDSPSDPWTNSEDELVTDGRDGLLFEHVRTALPHAAGDAERLARMAWTAFQNRADLRRPRGRDGEPWDYRHALEKAHYALERGAPVACSDPIDEQAKQAFVSLVNDLCVEKKLSTTAARVSKRMVAYIGSAGGCYAAVARIAQDTGLEIRSVRRSREELVLKGLWLIKSRPQLGGMPLYVPNLARIASQQTPEG